MAHQRTDSGELKGLMGTAGDDFVNTVLMGDDDNDVFLEESSILSRDSGEHQPKLTNPVLNPSPPPQPPAQNKKPKKIQKKKKKKKNKSKHNTHIHDRYISHTSHLISKFEIDFQFHFNNIIEIEFKTRFCL
jgi:hypothetical protein